MPGAERPAVRPRRIGSAAGTSRIAPAHIAGPLVERLIVIAFYHCGPAHRVNFVPRTFVYAHWRRTHAPGMTAAKPVAFHTACGHLPQHGGLRGHRASRPPLRVAVGDGQWPKADRRLSRAIFSVGPRPRGSMSHIFRPTEVAGCRTEPRNGTQGSIQGAGADTLCEANGTMNATMMDTLRLAHRLGEAGFETPQAEGMARALGDELMERMVTKSDLDDAVQPIHARLDTMEAKFDGKFEATEARFDAVDAKIDSVHRELTGKFNTLLAVMALGFTLLVGLGGYNAVAPRLAAPTEQTAPAAGGAAHRRGPDASRPGRISLTAGPRGPGMVRLGRRGVGSGTARGRTGTGSWPTPPWPSLQRTFHEFRSL